ncbi:MAG: class I adenylate-forming enzyme family protein [Beijerinckiaceae bacterium]|nr:class I adenylate-forming enzyme family protein [Beijerinckiaceae bacterium]
MPAERNTILVRGRPAVCWGDVRERAERRFTARLSDLASSRILFVVDGWDGALDALCFSHAHDLDVCIVDAARLTVETREAAGRAGLSLFDAATLSFARADNPAAMRAGRVAVVTSGTTGSPKLVDHSWETLDTHRRARSLPPRRWFAPYQIGSYASYQLLCLSMFHEGQDLVLGDLDDLAASFSEALTAGVDAVSSTPTFWRFMLMSVAPNVLSRSGLKTISLGGEIVDQAILDRLRAQFPASAIRHIYASSEAGAAIVVTDGLAGFPASLLDVADSEIGLSVRDGRLFVRSAFSSHAPAESGDAWRDTGDLVEMVDGRVHFRGRVSATIINVGGMKAFPAEVEAQLMRHPDVVWAQVFARRAPMVGSLPSARIVLSNARKADAEAEAELTDYMQTRVPAYAVPRFWQFLDNIPVKASLKS